MNISLQLSEINAKSTASLSITNSWSMLKLMSIKSVMSSNYLILCCALLLPSIFPSIMVFSNESVLCIRCTVFSYSRTILSSSQQAGSFAEQKFLVLMRVNLILSFMNYAFGVMSKNFLACLRSRRFSPVFFLLEKYFKFKSVVHFQLTFV